MTRTVTRETISEPRTVRREARACDKCGKPISPHEIDDLFANELVIALNQDECVSTTLRRDYCTECLEPVWLAICGLIGADPDTEGFDRAEEDE